MMAGQTITLRLTIHDPVPGMVYSLQDKKNHPVGPVVAGAGRSRSMSPSASRRDRDSGDFVRSEGPTRRFVYIAIGGQAGAAETPWSRRAKIDIHTLPIELLEQALAGRVLTADLPGRAKDGGSRLRDRAPARRLAGRRVISFPRGSIPLPRPPRPAKLGPCPIVVHSCPSNRPSSV